MSYVTLGIRLPILARLHGWGYVTPASEKLLCKLKSSLLDVDRDDPSSSKGLGNCHSAVFRDQNLPRTWIIKAHRSPTGPAPNTATSDVGRSSATLATALSATERGSTWYQAGLAGILARWAIDQLELLLLETGSYHRYRQLRTTRRGSHTSGSL